MAVSAITDDRHQIRRRSQMAKIFIFMRSTNDDVTSMKGLMLIILIRFIAKKPLAALLSKVVGDDATCLEAFHEQRCFTDYPA